MAELQKTYNNIAKSFSSTRNHPWKEFEIFGNYLGNENRVLDLGCGNGRLYEFLSKNYEIEYSGMDLSDGLLTEATKKYPEAHFVHGNMAEDFPFPGETFQHVWAIASFHHLKTVQDRKKCLAEIHRILEPNGYFICTAWNLFQKKYWKYIWQAIKERIKGKRNAWNDTLIPWKNSDKGGETLRYYHAFYPRELRNILKKNGFEIVEEMYIKKGKRVDFLECFNICFVCRKI